MLAQYESPAKQQVDIKVKLTPEEKMHFREAQESDPKFLDANRKLEESLQKCNGSKNGSKFRFNVPQNRSRPGTAMNNSTNKKSPEIDASVVNLNSSYDAFDELVAATNSTLIDRNDNCSEDQKAAKSPNDSPRFSINEMDESFEQHINTKIPIDKSKQSSLSHTATGDSTINTTSNNETNSAATTKSSDSSKKIGRFVFRTATASKVAGNNTEIKKAGNTEIKKAGNNTEIKNVESVSSSISKPKRDDNDKYDVDTVLRELRDENRLPVGANRTRPNSPLKDTHATPKKPVKQTNVQSKVRENYDSDSPRPSTERRPSSSSNVNSFTSNSICTNSSVSETVGMTESRSKTGFENLQNVLDRISNSSAVKTTSNVSVSHSQFFFLLFPFD